MSQAVLVLNGPNLGRLGQREPEIYGRTTHADLAEICIKNGKPLGLAVEVRQTDSEDQLVEWLKEAASANIPVVLNPAAFTHYSNAVREACALHPGPIIEVHISNPHTRDEFRHKSVVSGVVTGTIAGFGIDSYRLALMATASRLSK
jgi:3-dehydroquinate dehydratase-2